MSAANTIKSVFSDNNTRIFISKKVEEVIRVAIDDIRSGRDTRIELDEFYESFDIYQQLLLKRSQLKNKLVQEPQNILSSTDLKKELDDSYLQEKKMRMDILELAMSLEIMEDSESVIQMKRDFKQGLLTNMNARLPFKLLQKRQDSVLKNKQQIKEVSQSLIINSNEFLIKAQLTNLNYDLTDRFKKAIFFYDKGMISAEAASNKYHLADYSYSYARFLYDHGQYTEAEPLYKRVLSVFRSNVKKYRTEIPAVLNSMGVLYRSLPSFKDAKKCYNNALRIYRGLDAEILSEVEDDLAKTLNNLAILELDHKSFGPSEIAFKEALVILKKLANHDPGLYMPDVALTLNNLGNLKADMDDYKGAFQVLQEALSIRKRLARKDPENYAYTVAMTLNNIGVLQMDHHKLKDAEKNFQQSVEIYHKLAKNNPERFSSSEAMGHYNLANLYYDNHKFEQAEKAFGYASGIYAKLAITSVEALLELALTKNSLGMTLTDLHKHTEAEKVHIEGIEILRQIENKFPKTVLADKAMALTNLGDLYRKINHENALPCYLEAVTIWNKLAKFYPDTYRHLNATTLSNLGLVYYDNKQWTKASKCFKDSLSLRKIMIEVDQDAYLPGFAETLNNATILNLERRQYDKAIEGFSETVKIYSELSNFNKAAFLPDLAMSLNNLGITMGRIKRYEDALVNYWKAYKIYNSLAKKQPAVFLPEVSMISLNIAEMLQEQKQNKRLSVRLIKDAIGAIISFAPTYLLYNDLEQARSLLSKWEINPDAFIYNSFGNRAINTGILPGV